MGKTVITVPFRFRFQQPHRFAVCPFVRFAVYHFVRILNNKAIYMYMYIM